MFCHKCGNQVAEDSAFCPKCGAKIKNDGGLQQVPTSATAEQGQPRTNDFQSELPQKKKLGKLPMIIGGVALVIIIAIVIAINWNGKIDYEATVRAHQPFTVTQGLPYTYEEVLDKYISSPDWKIHNSGDVNYVDVSGKAKGTDNELSVTIKVTEDPSDPDLAKITLESVTIDGKKSPAQNDAVEFLLAMFSAYDEGYNDLSDLLSETGLPEHAAGISSDNMAKVETTDWGIAYAAKVQELSAENNALQFALINLTDSDIPELVADYSGYNVSVFKWEGKALITLMDSPYGAGGNLGYEYLPSGNVIRNYNNDQAGTIVYESYMKVNDAHEAVDLYDESLSIWYFKDTNSNGLMDENEPYSEEPYYYYGEKEITEKEYASYQISGDYEQLTGDKSVEATLSQLGVEIEGRNQAVGDFLYNGIPVKSFFKYSMDEATALFGQPTYDGADGNGGYAREYNDEITFILFADTSETIAIETESPDVWKVGDVSLDKDRTFLIETFGNPTDEYVDEMTNEHVISYNLEGYILNFVISDSDFKISKISIKDNLSDEDYEDFDESAIDNQPNGNQQGNSKQATGVCTLESTTRKKSSSGNVYAAPSEFVFSTAVSNVNILNPEKIRYGCKIQIVTGKNTLGMYESYTIDEDGSPGGTVLTVVDATVID